MRRERPYDLEGDLAHTETYCMFVGMNRAGVPILNVGRAIH
jgi:hypothetical protein